MPPTNLRNVQELEDAFIKVTFEPDSPTVLVHKESTGEPVKDPLYEPWFERGSAKFVDPSSFGSTALRKLYPKHTVTQFYNVNLLAYPNVLVHPVHPADVVTGLVFVPLGRQMGSMSGIILDSVRFGCFKLAWDKYDYLLYVARYPQGFGEIVVQYILHEGPEEHSRSLLMAAGTFENDLHEEIFVFNQGFWSKDHSLWLEVQKANWRDVILKDEFKTNLKKDVRGFFSSEQLYKSLAIPWKRGLIMYGPPGNGKTISMKAIMKECDAKGYAPLYVRSFQSWQGEEAAMASVFQKARQMAPCVMVLEDLDSLINDQNRSFFLNELDGLEGNDGLLLIGSTNHYERLDPALSGRPSRFDRKYLFDDPDKEERTLYCKYWQNKLKSNEKIDFPDTLIEQVATATEKFSFAYLKEAFVSTLVLFAGKEKDDRRDFRALLLHQVKSLRDQLDKQPQHVANSRSSNWGSHPTQPPQQSFGPRDQSSLGRFAQTGRLWNTSPVDHRNAGNSMPGGLPGDNTPTSFGQSERRDLRNMALAAAQLGRSFIV